MNVLLIEDEEKVVAALSEALETEGFCVGVEKNGKSALETFKESEWDVVLLDLNLPKKDGLSVLSTIRREDANTPVLILTARDSLNDRLVGLNAGADDYIVKPFAVAEVLARIRAVTRRSVSNVLELVKVADVELDVASRRLTRAGVDIFLTSKEFDVFLCLARNADSVISRDTLAREIWKESIRSITLNNVIDVHIAKLRKKIDDGHSRKLIHTVRGVGFSLSEKK